MYWGVWSIERILILFTSVAFLAIGLQVTLFHYRQNFHQKVMWVPVILAPIIFIEGIAFSFYNAAWLRSLFVLLMCLGILSGLIGSYFHIRGVGIRVGGWALRNFLIGPPLTLPFMFTAMSVLGLIAVFWSAR
ncbi:hypothetical protein [Brevibacillus massiliensis]|jgi:hypothetical protein|uniref:hypothetical protein n=1 Tax=Brevibacillus massiliensis TaxID=1118054 RepID=UPI0002DC34CB|nr:hypothetical protein [Brevibacillus massiliensis]